MLRRRDLFGPAEVRWREYEAAILSTAWEEAAQTNGVSDVAFEEGCSYPVGPEGLCGFRIGVYKEADTNGYLDVDYVKVGREMGSWDMLDIDFQQASDLSVFGSVDAGITWQDGYLHIPRRSVGTFLGYLFPSEHTTGKVALQCRLRTNSMNCAISLDGAKFSARIIVCTNTNGDLYLKNSTNILARSFADGAWHTVNLVADMDKHTVSAWLEEEAETTWSFLKKADSNTTFAFYSDCAFTSEDGYSGVGDKTELVVSKIGDAPSPSLAEVKAALEGQCGLDGISYPTFAERLQKIRCYQDVYRYDTVSSLQHRDGEGKLVIGGIRRKVKRAKNVITAYQKSGPTGYVCTLPQGVYPGRGPVLAGSLGEGYLVRYIDGDFVYYEMERSR